MGYLQWIQAAAEIRRRKEFQEQYIYQMQQAFKEEPRPSVGCILFGCAHPECQQKPGPFFGTGKVEIGESLQMEVRKFETGSQRDIRDGKGRFDLLPPEALFALAKHFEQGAKKYEDRNWEKGQDLGSYCDSGYRHFVSWMAGYTDEDHLVAAAWNLIAAITTRERIRKGLLPSSLDNMPPDHLRGPNAMLQSGRQGQTVYEHQCLIQNVRKVPGTGSDEQKEGQT